MPSVSKSMFFVIYRTTLLYARRFGKYVLYCLGFKDTFSRHRSSRLGSFFAPVGKECKAPFSGTSRTRKRRRLKDNFTFVCLSMLYLTAPKMYRFLEFYVHLYRQKDRTECLYHNFYETNRCHSSHIAQIFCLP